MTAALIAVVAGPATPVQAQGLEGLVDLDGSSLTADSTEGDAILVFFASWSPRCRDVVQRVERLQSKWGARARVVLVSFQEPAEDVQEFLSGSEMRAQVARDPDGSFSKRHGITTLPSLLVLESGSVAFRGRFPEDADSVLSSVFD